MVNFLLDTSFIIEILRKNPAAIAFLEKHQEDKFFTSSICEAEIWEGIYREKKTDFSKKKIEFMDFLESLFGIIPFASEEAEIAGQIRSKLSVKGERIGDLDVLIAASAISVQATLLTKNLKHFSRVENLQSQLL